MYTYQYNDHSGDGAFLAVIDRECRRLMKQGGGALSRCCGQTERAPIKRTTPEQRAQVIALVQVGNLTGTEIARIVGVKQSLIQGISKRMGVTLPDGRIKANRERAAAMQGVAS